MKIISRSVTKLVSRLRLPHDALLLLSLFVTTLAALGVTLGASKLRVSQIPLIRTELSFNIEATMVSMQLGAKWE